MGRPHHVLVAERTANANRDRLLADARMQEARQIAGAETLDHLLFEPANQLHLAQELEQLRPRQAAALVGWTVLHGGPMPPLIATRVAA